MVVGGRKGEEREVECVAMIERNPPKGKPRARQPRAGNIVANKTQHRAAASWAHTHTHYFGPREPEPTQVASKLHGISAYPAPVQ
jgi:hypothetical protein